MINLNEKEILTEVKLRIQGLLKQLEDDFKDFPPKERTKVRKQIVENEINTILNIAFQNLTYFQYSKFSDTLPENCISTETRSPKLITTKPN